jgi:predicted acylesterase/phospholipase RssA
VLVLGAASVLSGRLQKFNSLRGPIKVEHILASCAVPSLFPAVEVDGDALWDGLFSDNPPIDDLIRQKFVGRENVPREIWLIKINPTRRDKIPTEIGDWEAFTMPATLLSDQDNLNFPTGCTSQSARCHLEPTEHVAHSTRRSRGAKVAGAVVETAAQRLASATFDSPLCAMEAADHPG